MTELLQLAAAAATGLAMVALTAAVDSARSGQAGGEPPSNVPRAARRTPPLPAVPVAAEALDEWLTTNSLWWLMLAPADQPTPQAIS